MANDDERVRALMAVVQEAIEHLAAQDRAAQVEDIAAYNAHGEAARAALARVTGPELERTPETVLRAMLAAYERAAESRGLEFYRTATGDMQNDMALIGPWAEAETAVDEVRSLLCWTLSERKGRGGVRWVIGQDYEARLRGDRPLDAPPLEAP